MLNENLFNSIVFNTDSYKYSHYKQYPPGTRFVSSYIEARGVKEALPKDSEVVMMGGQILAQAMAEVRLTKEAIDFAEPLINAHFGREIFNRVGFMDIVRKHDGRLPIRIEALPDGSVVPTGTPLMQVVNTDESAFWLTSFLETTILRSIWYPTTVATLSREVKKIIYANLLETSDDPDGQIGFKLHDFGARGASSRESAKIGGTAHLVNFLGTDTVDGLMPDLVDDFNPWSTIPRTR